MGWVEPGCGLEVCDAVVFADGPFAVVDGCVVQRADGDGVIGRVVPEENAAEGGYAGDKQDVSRGLVGFHKQVIRFLDFARNDRL